MTIETKVAGRPHALGRIGLSRRRLVQTSALAAGSLVFSGGIPARAPTRTRVRAHRRRADRSASRWHTSRIAWTPTTS